MFKIFEPGLFQNGLLILLGFVVGVISGFFGIGGAFILTPTLHILGLPMISAVGTGLAFTLAVSLYGGLKHFMAGNVSYRPALYVGLVSMAGMVLSEPLVRRLNEQGSADSVIRMVYIVLLLLLGYLTFVKGGAQKKEAREINPWLARLATLPPLLMIEGKRVSLWRLVFIGLFVGFLKGFLGVGGAFILIPLYVLVLDMEIHRAAGTSLATLLVSSVFGVYLYILSGNVLFNIALFLVAGTLFGVNIGVRACRNIKGINLQRLYASFLMLSALGILLKHLRLDIPSLIFTLGLSLGLSLLIILKYYFHLSFPVTPPPSTPPEER